MDIRNVFKERLNGYMLANSLNQKELASMLKVSHTTVNNWVMGHKVPRMDKIDALCRIFQCSRSELLEANPTKHQMILTKDETELLTYYRKLSTIDKGRLLGELSIKCRDMENE